MRKYAVQTITQPEIKDALVLRSRQQAFDVFISKLLKYLIPIIAIEILCYVILGEVLNIAIVMPALLLALFDYAKALFNFTIEDRESLFSYTSQVTEVAKESEVMANSNDSITVIPQVNGKSVYYLHVALSDSQLKAIASTILDTKTLTVNYLESLGISRANSEKIRAEFARMEILQFDDKGRVKATDNGIKICKRIIKD